jgi:hypothetical protein
LYIYIRNSLGGNFETLKYDADDKEYKYNNVLRELEVKIMHIDQLESMLKRKDDELEHLRQTNSKIIGSGGNKTFSSGLFTSNENVFRTQNFGGVTSDENRKYNSSDEFQKNEDNEKQLKRLMSYNTSERTETTRQPGKIFSIKK